MRSHRLREHPGQEGPDQAEEERRARSKRDQREHVGRSVPNRARCTHEEGPAAPDHDRRRKHELDPGEQPGADRVAHRIPRDDVGHREEEERDRQHRGDDEAPLHVGELGLRCRILFGAQGLRLERHPALRAIARAELNHLRVHRAGVFGRRFLRRGRLRRLRLQVRVRARAELLEAARTAEVEARPGVLERVLGRRRIDAHPADGIVHVLPGRRDRRGPRMGAGASCGRYGRGHGHPPAPLTQEHRASLHPPPSEIARRGSLRSAQLRRNANRLRRPRSSRRDGAPPLPRRPRESEEVQPAGLWALTPAQRWHCPQAARTAPRPPPVRRRTRSVACGRYAQSPARSLGP